MQIKSITKLFWILPFLSFVLGYLFLDKLYTIDKIATPNLVGKQLTEAIKITSGHNLNLRIISEQVDNELPENTILSQKPTCPNIRPNQAIFVVVSKKPNSQLAPNLCGYHEKDLTKIIAQENLKIKTYYLPSKTPHGICIGQSPQSRQTLTDQKLLIYLSAGSTPWKIIPKFSGLTLPEVQSFLNTYQIKVNVKYLPTNLVPENNVIDQNPSAGTIVNLNKLVQIELCVAKKP